MKLDARTVAYVYALIRDEWRELEAELEFANDTMDYGKQDEINERLPVVRENMRKAQEELSEFIRKEGD